MFEWICPKCGFRASTPLLASQHLAGTCFRPAPETASPEAENVWLRRVLALLVDRTETRLLKADELPNSDEQLRRNVIVFGQKGQKQVRAIEPEIADYLREKATQEGA